MAEKERQRQTGGPGAEDFIFVTVNTIGRRFEYHVPRGTRVGEVLKRVEKTLNQSLEGFTVRVGNRNLAKGENPVLEQDVVSIALIKRLVGGIAA